MRVELGPAISRAEAARSQAFDVSHIKGVPPGIVNDGAGKPTDGNQAEQFGLSSVKIEDGDRVLRSVANEQPFSRPIESQRIGLRAEKIGRILAGAYRFDDFVVACIDDGERVAAGISDDEPTAVGRERHGGGVQAREKVGGRRSEVRNHPRTAPG